MSQSAKNKDRQKQADRFREQAKKQAAQQKVQKTHLVPETEWQSTDVLSLRGDILDAQEQKLALIWQGMQELMSNFQHLASTFQMVIQQNINEDKIKLKYKWNNGEPATEQDVANFQKQMKAVEVLQKQKAAEGKKEDGEATKTGLVNEFGEALTSDGPKPEANAEVGDPKLLQEDEEVHYDSNLADEKISEEKEAKIDEQAWADALESGGREGENLDKEILENDEELSQINEGRE